MLRFLSIVLCALAINALAADDGDAPDPGAGWDFAFKDFVIAAWYPPPATRADYELVKGAHFNLVMTPRYSLPGVSLDLAQEFGLKVMIDTYAPNDKPWGGAAGEYMPHPSHHPATLPELKWLHERWGGHPALAGFLLGDDYGRLPQELIDTTNFLRDNAPHLFPWICQNNFQPKNLADNGNPLSDPQFYPMLYQAGLPVEQQAAMFCDLLERQRKACIRLKLVPWPMFNVSGVKSDSLIRFQPYACLAHGAQGIWYFHYNDLIDRDENDQPVPNAAYEVAQEVNAKVATWGPALLGRHCSGTITTGPASSDAREPGEDSLVLTADENLLVGVLVKDGADTLAMVVDTRVHRDRDALDARTVAIEFAPAVEAVTVMADGTQADRTVDGNRVSLELQAGEGALLRLEGEGVRDLVDAMAARPARPATMPELGPERLMAQWSFEEGEGDVARDAGGLGNDLKLTRPVWAEGKAGKALDLRGEGSIGTLFRAKLPPTDAMSMEAWVKPTKYPETGYGCVLYLGRGTADRFEFGFGPDNIYPVITNGYDFAHGNLYVAGMKARIPEGQWGHIAIVADRDGAATYVNGERVRETDFQGEFDFWGVPIELGARQGREEFEGLVDEVRIWGRALSAEEIKARLDGPED